MIARRMRGNAVDCGGLAEAEYGITGASRLEGADLLQVFAFEKQLGAG
jgi:hypothetical protein